MAVKIGDTFRSTYCDGNCLWTVDKKAGPQAWSCVIKDKSDLDYFGTVKLFSTQEIEATRKLDDFFANSRNSNEQFYANLKVGQIVHYHNGFKEYVRCKVLQDKTLLPIALVGEWRKYDLPHRREDGSIDYGHHAKSIIEKEPFKPNASNIFEYQALRPAKERAAFVNAQDPVNLAAVDLSVPDMTPEEADTAEQWRHVANLQNILANRVGNERKHENPRNVLNEVCEYLTSHNLT